MTLETQDAAGSMDASAAHDVAAPGILRQFFRIAANLLLAALIALWISALVLQTGVMRRSETMTGPFAVENVPGSQIKIFPLRRIFVVRGFVRAVSDAESRSSLRLWINGQQVGPPHTEYAALKDGAPGYQHWGNSVLFVLPPGVPNSAQTVVRAEYPVQTPPGRATLIFLAAGVLTQLLHRKRIGAWLKGDGLAARQVTALPHYILFAFGWTVLTAGAVYVAIVMWGLATGEALTLAIPFRSQAAKATLEWLDPAIPLSLLLLATVGVAMGWVAAGSPQQHALQRADLSAIRWLRRYGLPVLGLFYLASVGATWAGNIRYGNSGALVGLFPYFDAAGYFADANAFLRDGTWSEFTSRRPLAGAFRISVLLLGDMRYTIAVALQTVAISVVAYLGAMAVMRWRGLWAGIAYLALSYILVRSYFSTTLTEPVSLIVALGSIPFFVEALRRKSRPSALLAILLMSAAIWMRPGAMFLIPALPLWFGLYFGNSFSEKVKQFGIACSVVLAMFAFDALLGRMFGSGSIGNFGYTICGLTVGESFTGCLVHYPQEAAQHSQTPEELQRWLFVKAIENIRRDPGPLLNIMIRDPIRFVSETPRVMLTGYSSISLPIWFPVAFWFVSVIVFCVATLRRRLIEREALFWGIAALGLISSATLFYFSDGVRTYSVVYPLVALFIVLAIFSPSSVVVIHQAKIVRQFRAGRWAIAAGALLLVAIPLAGRFLYHIEPARLTGASDSNAIVGSITKSAGVLVVADDQPLPHGVPSVHFSDFAAYVHYTGVEGSQGIITPMTPRLPFGAFLVPRLDTPSPENRAEKKTPGAIALITPPEFAFRRNVRAWKMAFTDWNQKGGLFSRNWSYVTDATPYETSLALESRQ
jgi:hypothetical protein